jgi:hypothetical protein
MTNPRSLLIALACTSALGLGACANSARSSTTNLPTFRDAGMSLQAASDSVAPGKTTKAEALAALGAATVVKFDSGFEVWIYRLKPPSAEASAAEFVILFTPDGIASKTRIRPQDGKTGG